MSEKKNYPVITISREYAAGGRTVARAVSEKLGIPWYDRVFVEKTAEKSGYSVEEVRKEGEQISPAGSVLNGILNNAAAYISSYDAINAAQKKVILEFAKSPCIIVGRCANFILRDAEIPSFDIFLYADFEFRLKRAAELKENGNIELRRYVDRMDDLRETYYRHYTRHELGDYHDYDLLVNTGRIGLDRCGEYIAGIIDQIS